MGSIGPSDYLQYFSSSAALSGMKRERRRTIPFKVQYEGHCHPLEFMKISDQVRQRKCNACYSNCDSYAFRCVDVSDLSCTFSLHHTCGPLPDTIKHKCHIHPLILTHSLATYENYQRDDEFYCDACEKERDPLLPIYQCMECQFAAELKCVISEVLSLLRGEHGGVELRGPLGQLGRVITTDAAKEIKMGQKKEEQRKPALTTLSDIFKSLSEDEKNELSCVEEAFEREKATAKKILSQNHDEVLLFSDKAYTKFIKFLDDHSIDIIPIEHHRHYHRIDIPIESHGYRLYSWEGLEVSRSLGYSGEDFKVSRSQGWDVKDEVVDVGDYAVEQRLAPILKHLLSKHGDISAESMLKSPRVKVFLFNMLCWCIDHMTNIKVVDITHELLIKWSARLKTLQRAGFRIQFAVDQLKRLSRAHFGLYVREHVDNALEEINRDIDRLEKDLKARKVKRERITYAESTKSTFIAECLKEASVLKKWKGGIGLPPI